jgi:DNA repair exonuclease SbcCD ATPase subunit
MKIHLKNFRCYTNKIFDIKDNSLVLISGQSGVGKSTILIAINFCLYDVGKKIKTFGKTSCSVTIEINDLKITRTKTPDTLTLIKDNKEFADDAAQNIVNQIFGEAFDVVSYLQQNALNSFISMSPTNKLDFIESFAFKDINLKFLKEKCKDEINKRKSQLLKTTNSLELTTNIFNEMEKPKEVIFPLKVKKEDYERVEKSQELKIKNCVKRIKISKKCIVDLQQQLKDYQILQTFISSKDDSVNDIIEEINNLSLNDSNDTDSNSEEYLQDLKSRLKNLISKKELINLQDNIKNDKIKLEEMKNAEINNYNIELEKIEKNLWKEYSKDEVVDGIKETKEFINDAKQIKMLKKKLDKYDEKLFNNINLELTSKIKELKEKEELTLEYNNYKIIYKCPSCNVNLQLLEFNLLICNDINKHCENKFQDYNDIQIKNEIEELKEDISSLEIKISKLMVIKKSNETINNEIEQIESQYEEELDINSLEEQLEYYEKYLNNQIKLEDKQNDIQKIINENILSDSLKIFENKIKNQEKEILKIENDIGEITENLQEEELRDILNKEENLQKNRENHTKRIENLQKDKIKYETQILDKKNKYISLYNEFNEEDEDKILNMIQENKEIISTNEANLEKHENNIKQIEQYKKYIIELEKYQNFQNKVDDLKKQEIENKNKHSASLIFKEKILEAESIAIHNIIENINFHSQTYLDYFFPENTIIVRLLAFKETKKNTKPQINLEINYKGNDCELNSLSGGELARVTLAFTLTLNEIFNSPILILDESTASLDQELTNIVFNSIKDNFKNKIILVVAHQVVEGIFDQIINL